VRDLWRFIFWENNSFIKNVEPEEPWISDVNMRVRSLFEFETHSDINASQKSLRVAQRNADEEWPTYYIWSLLTNSFKASSYNLQWDSNLYDFIMEYLSSEN
jgi:hypothetical protein